MKYSDIAQFAPRLAACGFTHVQFPPIQEGRILSELDIPLIAKQLQVRDAQLRAFETLCKKASAKAAARPGDNYEYLLQRRVNYIRQPLFRDMHKYILQGVECDNLLEYIFETTVYGVFIASGGCYHPPELMDAAELILKLMDEPDAFDEEEDAELRRVSHRYAEVQDEIQKTKPNIPKSLLQELNILKGIKLRLVQKKQNRQAYLNNLEKLHELLPITAAIRARTRTPKYRCFNVPKKLIFNKQKAKHWLDCMTICELLMYPPWWLIYQPMRLAIGNTFLGSKEDIYNAINVCRENGLEVIADIVINNLAAVPGERQSWLPYASAASESSRTLADVVPVGTKHPSVSAIKDLLRGAFGSDDLELLTAPNTSGWMSGALPQLNQCHPIIQTALQKFINSLKEAGVSGVRIDAAEHISPNVCEKVISNFPLGISYVEYTGKSPELYKSVCLEDFDIANELWAEATPTTNKDHIAMIINHDHLMGTLHSPVFVEVPSEREYELLVSELLNFTDRNLLLLIHETDIDLVATSPRNHSHKN